MAFVSSIKTWIVGVKNFIKDAHSENGKPSFSRWAQGMIVYNTIAWVWYSVIKHGGAIPDLTSPAIFVTGAAAGHYGIGQVKNWVNGKKNGNGADPNADPDAVPPKA